MVFEIYISALQNLKKIDYIFDVNIKPFVIYSGFKQNRHPMLNRSITLLRFSLISKFLIQHFAHFSGQGVDGEGFLDKMDVIFKNTAVEDDVSRIAGHVEDLNLRLEFLRCAL